MKDKFIEFLYNKELILKEDNVYYAKRAFKMNAIARACMRETDPKLLSKYLFLIEKFLAGAIDITIKDDKLMVRKIKKDLQKVETQEAK
tara:strand:- start:275 stop:541 length:267 start_codon:yes stop_codon:yes gene_type:complete